MRRPRMPFRQGSDRIARLGMGRFDGFRMNARGKIFRRGLESPAAPVRPVPRFPIDFAVRPAFAASM